MHPRANKSPQPSLPNYQETYRPSNGGPPQGRKGTRVPLCPQTSTVHVTIVKQDALLTMRIRAEPSTNQVEEERKEKPTERIET